MKIVKLLKQLVVSSTIFLLSTSHGIAYREIKLSLADSIYLQLSRCWSPPAGAKDTKITAIRLHVQLFDNGTVTSVKMLNDQNLYQSDPLFRALADSAIRSVMRCSPIKNLPAQKYNLWKEIELVFDVKDALK
jgi:hypothetical protein